MSDRFEDILKYRQLKLANLKALGIDPYPSTTERSHTNSEVIENFTQLMEQEKPVTIVGRIRSWRTMGKLIFAHIEDGTAKIQVLFKEDEVGSEKFTILLENVEMGDFLQATGKLFITNSGEKTVQSTDYSILAKSLLPIPTEHFGLQDEETRLRKRYLDILLNPEAKQQFVKKNIFWSSMRKFLVDHGFLELEMPVLESVPGGAEAEPFITHHNALDKDFYLRISLELPLKKMLVAGYEKVFEIGRIFRNEGIDTEHLQDYTQMEFYWAYGDFAKLMSFAQEMYQYVIQETFGTLEIPYQNQIINWSGTWPRLDYFDLFKKYTGIDLNTTDEQALKDFANASGIKYEASAGRGRLIDLIFKKKIRVLPEVAMQPAFLINQPVELEPLAKRDPKNPKVVQRMQILACGSELGKGFGELNDPVDQRSRFEDQMKLREAGDAEAQMIDESYIEAMEYGMPPCAGFGISERLFAVLCDKSIRETVIFPPMHDAANKTGKSKETKIAVAVINKGINLEPWKEMNTMAHLNAAFGARMGKSLLYQDSITTKDEQKIKLNIQHAIIIKKADSTMEMAELIDDAKKSGLEISEFTREMLETTDDKKVISKTKEKNLGEIEYLGVLLFGNKSAVEAITKKLALFS